MGEGISLKAGWEEMRWGGQKPESSACSEVMQAASSWSVEMGGSSQSEVLLSAVVVLASAHPEAPVPHQTGRLDTHCGIGSEAHTCKGRLGSGLVCRTPCWEC